MEGIPVLGFAGYSGSGKTTLLERLIPALRARGLRVAVIKHDVHALELDQTGKDTWRFAQAGAEVCAASGPGKSVVMEQRPGDLRQLLGLLRDVDLALVEGFKQEAVTQIGLCRKAAGKPFPEPLKRYIAVVTDVDTGSWDIPRFGFDEIQELTEFIMQNMADFTHFDAQGRAKMVDVGDKPSSRRSATAAARVLVSRETLALIQSGGMKKGDVLTVAQIAGVMGAKRTPDLIPMCHPICLEGIEVGLTLDEARCGVEITATVRCDGKTGVEMEALTAAATAALTVYDMCKAVQKDMIITDLRLMDKSGGVHGEYHREETI